MNEVNPYITQYGRENVYNSDQSGFQLEMHSGRTFAVEGPIVQESIFQPINVFVAASKSGKLTTGK